MNVSFYSTRHALDEEWEFLSDTLEPLRTAPDRTNGELVRQLEREVSRRTGAGHAVACNSGTDALVALLLASGVGPGDEVVVPVYSFFATASCVVHVGATPVFVDVDPDSYAMTAEGVRSAVTERTKAVLVVHLFHQMADMRPLRQVCAEHGLTLLEDSAEAIGMSQGGVHAGRFGAGGVLSFFPTKTWGGLGDCGVVVTDDAGLATRVREVVTGEAEHAWCSAADEVQAAVLLAKARRLDKEIERRRRLAARYDAGLCAVEGVLTPRLKEAALDQERVWYVYLIEAERRDELADFLASKGIGTEAYYPRTIAAQPCFASHAHRGSFPHAEQAATRALGLPLYPDLADAEVDEVCAAITQFYAAEENR
ncbi:putative aminotransferase [Streptomyces coelicoflavus ZG0656]|nr:putative aminotransferase [Streptomyces coelicoflavus ZG0656]MZE49252.1 aminotransferase class I/II-fold pyridoxal phosphate-dependent enzyme [Streptomyces sp. SID5477]